MGERVVENDRLLTIAVEIVSLLVDNDEDN
jgi:hypothetical protein